MIANPLRFALLFCVPLFCFTAVVGALANDIDPAIENYTANKASGAVTLNGDLSEWTGVDVIDNPQFVPNGGGDLITFEPFGNGTWSGVDDQSSTVQVTWDDDNVYLGIVVTDDYHENAANSGWNGDAVQVHIANAARDAQVALYNYARGGVEGALGDLVIHHEAGPGGTEAAVERSGTTTTYEIKFPKDSLGLAELAEGTQLGIGFTINDGDEAPENGQKGWGGWGPHSVVFGKTPSETGLVTLGAAAPTGPPHANGLVAYWPLDGGPEDAVGGFHGEPMGGAPLTFTDGKFGQGVDLDGVDQFIQVGGDENVFDFQGGTGFTISTWFRVDAFTKSWQALVAKGEGNRWRVHRRGGENILTGNGGNADVPAGTTDVNDGEIHHLALVSDPVNGTVDLWIDGAIEASNTNPNVEDGANPMMIGENPDARGRTWDGLIDDVAAWNRPLSADEIAAIWADGLGASIGSLISTDTPVSLPIAGTVSLLGTGTGALLGGDLTDPEDDGNDAEGAALDGSWNWVSINADDEPDFEGGEGAFNVFDNKLGPGNDKWCCTDAAPDNPRWIAVEFAEPISLTHFTISSANDVPGRDPTWWHIEGSNDGVSWDPIFVQNDAVAIWTERLQVARVDLDQAAPGFTWFRYIAFQNDSNLHQLGEIELFGRPAVGAEGPDSDLDGLRDTWELANLGDLNSGGDDDNDGDGLTNKQELREGTKPQNADTDGDGLTDGEEFALGINPNSADTDGDGLSDGLENSLGTWPGQGDSDFDGFGDASELCYFQDYQLADGTTDLGDGSIFNNNQDAGSVLGGALQLTTKNVNSQAANYLLPPFGGLATTGFTASFDLTLDEDEGGNPPADGFSFGFGAIADDASAGEEGHPDGLVISFDTWDNGGEGADTGIGVDVRVDDAEVATNRIGVDEDKNNNSIFNFDGVTRKVVISYSGDGTEGTVSVSLGGNLLYSGQAVAWAPEAGDRIAFGARTGGATETVRIDNLAVACSATGNPLELDGTPQPPTISELVVRSLDLENVGDLNGMIAGPLADGSGIISEVSVEASSINYRDDGGARNFANDQPYPIYGTFGGHEDIGLVGTGKINVPVAGFWTFLTSSDDGSILRVNGVDVIDDRTNHGTRNRYGAIELTAGEHDFEYLFYERGGGAACELGVALTPGDHTDGTNNSATGGGASYVLLENPGFPLAASVRDFNGATGTVQAPGGIQGAGGWSYGYRNVATDGSATNDYDPAADFIQFPTDWWRSDNNTWDEPNADGDNVPWTTIGAETVHPNGDNNGEIHWDIRRWTSNFEGDVVIDWHLRKTNLNCGNGVTGGVWINGVSVDEATIAFDDGDGVSRQVEASISAGDVIDMVQGPLGTDGTNNDGCDGSATTMQITALSASFDGLCHEWWQNGNPGNRAGVEGVFASRPADNIFKGTDGGGTGTWWTGNGGAIPGIQDYPPVTTLARDNYMTRISGEIKFPEAGEYKFKDGVDDYTFLWIDVNDNGIEDTGEVLIDDNAWTGIEGNQNGGSPIATVTASAGWVNIVMYTAEGGGGDGGVLYWDYGPGGPGTGVGFPAAQTDAIDLAANGADLLVPESCLRCLPAADCDGDGIADHLEIAWFGDLSQDLDDDSDNDRSINADELAMGTDPSVKDSDGDGLWDGEEWIEPSLATLPSVADTDGDGVSDGDELRVYGTNPNSADTDGDGIDDGTEIANACLYFQNFNHLADGTDDLGDGSIISSNDAANPGVLNKALRVTEEGVNSQLAAYQLPHLGISGGDWAAAFDISLEEAAGGNPPADGFTFNFGNTADGAFPPGAAEEGYGTGLDIEFDTWGNDIGIDVVVNDTAAATARMAEGGDPNDNEFFKFDGSTHRVEVVYQEAVLGSGRPYDEEIKSDGPVAYWRFEGSGILSVTETNLGGDEPAVINTDGFGEDTLTFSDRTHQHNGAAFDDDGNLSTSGANIIDLPAYLLGADYVQFANNARDQGDYSATLWLRTAWCSGTYFWTTGSMVPKAMQAARTPQIPSSAGPSSGCSMAVGRG